MTKLTLTILSISFYFFAFSHNGNTSYSYPINNAIKIDGDLDDWPDATLYPVGNHVVDDFEAFFKTCYDSIDNLLYIAMQVTDDIHIIDKSKGTDWDRREDRHLLFLDFDHSMDGGSGVMVLFGNQSEGDLLHAPNGWDPFHEVFGKQDLEVAIKRIGHQTTYEWKVKAPVSLKPFSSFGMDHYVHDADDKDGEVDYYEWGPGGYKDRLPFRLGDIVLLEERAPHGRVEGSIRWVDRDSDRKLPSKVLIQSVENKRFWTSAVVDSLGRFTKDLPEGKYLIMSMQKTAVRKGEWDIERIDEASSAEVTVEAETSNVVNLEIGAFEKPDFLIPSKGMLSMDGYFDADQLDAVLKTFKSFYQIPGVSLSVIKDGILIYNQHLGTANRAAGTSVSSQTRFEIASVSKPIFAFAVHRLAVKGIIDLDKPLYRYAPFESIAHDPRHKALTARLVLSHQTGLPNWLWDRPRDWENNERGVFIGDPGSGEFYSGEAYEYLMRVMEKISGKSIQDVIQAEVFEVFGMNQSSYTADAGFASEIAVGHLEQFPMFWEVHHKPWVSGGLYSTAQDLTKFATGILNKIGLTESQYDEMLKPHVEIEPWVINYGGDKQYWSLGFEVEDTPQGRFYHHDGSNWDFESRLCLNQEQRYGYVLLTNNGNGEYLDRVLQRALITGRSDTATPSFD